MDDKLDDYVNTYIIHDETESFSEFSDRQIEARSALTKLMQEREVAARIGMVEYYDQVPANEDMNWKSLFKDNLAALKYEQSQLQEGKS